MSQKIGLFGGTFDPVHNGHISIAESFLNSGFIDELWVLLTPFPPHKIKEDHTGYALRYQMLIFAFEDIAQTKILTIENDLPKPSYTFRTIQFLKEQHPSSDFYFCMGEDSLTRFHTWKFHENILEQANLLVANRPGTDHSNVKNYILDKTTFVDHEPLEISSSKVREEISLGSSSETLIPAKIASYIEKEGLYR